MTPPKLKLRGLRKEYDDGAVVAVDHLDLTLEAGETLAILGPSGCGKSTTLNMIVGIEQPTSGDILIDGVSVLDQPAGQRSVGLVFQDYAVFTHMTVAQNLAFGLKVRGLSRQEISNAVGETSELLGLGDMLKTRAAHLGGSELQRVAIGRTLVTRPALLLLDEPLSNLETEMRGAMRRELRRLQKEIGLTIVYVTHDQVEALSLAQSIAVMSNGKLRQCGPTHEVYDQPAHTFVAQFIGDPPMNLINGALEKGETGQTFVSGALRVDRPAGRAPSSAQVLLGVRPNGVRVSHPSQDQPMGRIARIEPRGSHSVLQIELGQTKLDAVLPSKDCPPLGADVGVSLDPGRVVLFDDDTQTNLREIAS